MDTWVPKGDPVESKPVVAQAPTSVFQNGLWKSDLIVEIFCNRFLYHLPCDRQVKIYQNRYGIHPFPKNLA